MTLSYRISTLQYQADDQFERLMDLLKAHRPVVDEVALFTSFTHHMYIPLEVFARRCDLMARRLGQLRDARFKSVGINMLCTIGHLDEAWDIWPPLPFDRMVGHDGGTTKSCACPTSKEFVEYTRQAYRLVGQAKPDFVWVDDDLRMHHHTILWGCFCERCVKLFAAKHRGAPTSRKELVRRLDSPSGAALREAWVQNNNLVIANLLADIRKTTHRVSPKIATGLMTYGPSWGGYSGIEFDRWLKSLGARKARPGGGFYADHAPSDMIYKAFETARQIDLYHGQATDVQYELENFVYHKLDKSVQSVINECWLSLAAGCNGIAFNALNDMVQSMDDYRDLMKGIEQARPLWDRYIAAAVGLPMVGIWPAWDRRMVAKRSVNGDWFAPGGEYDFNRAIGLAGLGLPLTTSPQGACATILTGKLAEIFSDRQLKDMLTGGVMIDGPTLQILHARGLGHLAGVKVGTTYDNGVWETLAPHPINGAFAGDCRDVRTSFGGELSYELVPMDSGVEVLARLTGYDGRDMGPGACAFENELGGRVITLGYGPWSRCANTAKRSQLMAMADWVSRGRSPLRIDKTLRVLPMVRMSPDRKRLAVVLLNARLDPTGPFDLRLRAAANKVSLITADGLKPLAVRKEGDERIVTIKNIPPWQTAVVVSK